MTADGALTTARFLSDLSTLRDQAGVAFPRWLVREPVRFLCGSTPLTPFGSAIEFDWTREQRQRAILRTFRRRSAQF
jgi:hypothetical protein